MKGKVDCPESCFETLRSSPDAQKEVWALPLPFLHLQGKQLETCSPSLSLHWEVFGTDRELRSQALLPHSLAVLFLFHKAQPRSTGK